MAVTINGTTGITTPTESVATTVGVGGATPANTGAGVSFPATQNPSSDANTLDDYEEGTWTPSDTSGAGLTITSYLAQYIKIGRFVMAQFDIQYPSTANASSAQFSLPFTSLSSYSSGYFGFTGFSALINQQAPGMIVNGGAANARVMAGGTQLANSQCSSARLAGTVCYYTSA